VYFGPERRSVSEIFDAVLHCEFADTKDFDVSLRTDNERQISSSEYTATEAVVNNQAAAGRPHFRHNVQMVPQAGEFGSFVQVDIEKTIPNDGAFKYFGFDSHHIPHPEIDPEFIMGGDTVGNGW
jgi:hypothetical protein